MHHVPDTSQKKKKVNDLEKANHEKASFSSPFWFLYGFLNQSWGCSEASCEAALPMERSDFLSEPRRCSATEALVCWDINFFVLNFNGCLRWTPRFVSETRRENSSETPTCASLGNLCKTHQTQNRKASNPKPGKKEININLYIYMYWYNI